jgi:hypothetical protein
MHLHGEILNRYVRRELPAGQLASIDAHVSNCMFCADPLAEARAAGASWERRGWLGRLVRVELERSVAERPIEELELAA